MKVRNKKRKPPLFNKGVKVSRKTLKTPKGLMRIDPTRTLAIRQKFNATLRRQFGRLRLDILKLLGDENALGLTTNVFCSTGEGGGVDPSCSASESSFDIGAKHTIGGKEYSVTGGGAIVTRGANKGRQAVILRGSAGNTVIKWRDELSAQPSSPLVVKPPQPTKAPKPLAQDQPTVLTEEEHEERYKPIGRGIVKLGVDKSIELFEQTSDSIKQDLIRFAKNEGVSRGLKDMQLKKVLLSKIKPSQEGEDRINESSKASAETIGSGDLSKIMRADIGPILLGPSMKIEDGNHRFTAAQRNGQKYIYALVGKSATPTGNVFCPTGEGGGIDSSCSKGETSDQKSMREASKIADSPQGKQVHQFALEAAGGAGIRLRLSDLRNHLDFMDEPLSREGQDKVIRALEKVGKLSLMRLDDPREITKKDELHSIPNSAGSPRHIVYVSNIFCATGEGGGVDSSCGTGGASDSKASSISERMESLPAKLVAKIKDTVQTKYTSLTKRYGSKYAKAIIGAALIGLPIPLPGSSFITAAPVLAVAELHKMFSKSSTQNDLAYNDVSRVLDEEEIQEAAKELLDGLREEFKGVTANDRWRFNTSQEKLRAFQLWLKQRIDLHLLGLTNEQLWELYIDSGFRKGAARAFDDTKASVRAAMGRDQGAVRDFYNGTKDQFLRSSFNQPETVEKAKLLASRSFDELKNVTEEMGNKMARALTDGLIEGRNPYDVAKDVAEQADVSESRAILIARTELIRAHAEGQLEALDALGVEEVGVMVEWSTAGDDRVCELCLPLEGVVLKLEEAKGMIPRHPNCRCAWIPAGVGEEKEEQKGSKSLIDIAIGRSVDLDGGEESTKWVGADKDISVSRPVSILDNSFMLSPTPDIPQIMFDFNSWFDRIMTENVFCPTGEGGGVDSACSPSSGSGLSLSSLQDQTSEIHQSVKQKVLEAHADASCKMGQGAGKCDQVSVSLWKKLGSPKNLVPYSVLAAEDEHVILHDRESGLIIDPTGYQFGNRIFTEKRKAGYTGYKKLTKKDIEDAENLLKYSTNVFCSTGEGGGIDPSCSAGGSTEKALASIREASEAKAPATDPKGLLGPYISVSLPTSSSPEISKALRETVLSKSRKEATVSTSSLVATQAVVRRGTVEWAVKEIAKSAEEREEGVKQNGLPLVIKAGDKHYIYDGHHRLEASKLSGEKSVRVNVIVASAKVAKLLDKR